MAGVSRESESVGWRDFVRWSPVLAWGMVVGLLTGSDSVSGAESVDFARDVYPILRRACFECHGPLKQEAELRLDDARFALREPTIIRPGQADASELVRRIRLPAGDAEIMPSRGAPLKPAEIERIVAWIDAGAIWPTDIRPARHWAYVPPSRPVPPIEMKPSELIHNPIDAWILQRLHREGLSFAPRADQATLIRRLSLDLIGLPPSVSEVERFERDDSPEAYERLVDSLLASEQYGVKWARSWLDYARYADSHGFQRDDFRDLWPYRDWVVNALNADMPFTQFTIEQLAGDLLPEATESQRVATGFNRSAPTNVEAGSDPEETRVNQVHDRVHTLGMVWLGTTLECAQCHDHKYDPFTQRDYYKLFAFFNNTALEADRTNPKVPGSIQFRGPTMEVADAALTVQRAQLTEQIDRVKDELAALAEIHAADLTRWEANWRARLAEPSAEHVLKVETFESLEGATGQVLDDQSILVGGEMAPETDTYVITARTTQTGIGALKIEALTDDSLPGRGPGRGDAKRPNFVLNRVVATLAPVDDVTRESPIPFRSAEASFSQANQSVKNLLKDNNPTNQGWAINPRFHESHWARLGTSEPIGYEQGSLLRIRLEQQFGGARTIGRVRVSVLTGDAGGEPVSAELRTLLTTPAADRTAKQREQLVAFRMQEVPEYVALKAKREAWERALKELQAPTTLVMQEQAPRSSTVFLRGDFRSPGDAVEAGTPTTLHAMPVNASPALSRLDLARWLVQPENPLVARVVVNRWWGELMGQGLVGTYEDFGIQGEPPTHPELLDWLACEFIDQGWSQKKIIKTMVMSRAYQQASRIESLAKERDARNGLYSRGPRQRLEAELIRDNALAIAGLLNRRLGGPPIRPYQPDGLWIKVGGQRYDYVVSPGAEKYRRGLYVVWKRGAPYPSFVNFDANNRMACRVWRTRSNTPLQALVLMNDPVYVEAAQAFAQRIWRECAEQDDAGKIRYAFRLALARAPREDELAILLELLRAERAARMADPAGVERFFSDQPRPDGLTAMEWTAWYAVAATLLNLDECISKG
jgi:hypothetical protein